MRLRWLIIVLLSVGLIFYMSLRSHGTIALGQPVPDFALATESGQTLRLESLRGQVVLLNFWATFCHACATEMPSLNRLAAHFAGKKVQIIGVSEDGPPDQAWQQIQSYEKRIPIDFPIVLDPHGHVADQYGTFMLPETYLIDRQGRLVRKIVGVLTWDKPDILAEIEQLLR